MGCERKYKEALERARKLYEKGTITESLNYVFPELKESEDEKIRKHLISLVKNWDKDGIFSKYTSNPKEIKQILAWLEKQSEPKAELATEDEIYWLAWAIGRLPDTEEADEAESVLKELFEKLKKMKGGEE